MPTPRKRRPAKTAANFRRDTDIFISHAELCDSDLEWLTPVQDLTLWNVKMPPRFLTRLPNLVFLEEK